MSLISSVQEEPTERVIVALVITEEASDGQVDRHLVPSLQVHGHDHGGTVLLILHVHLVQICYALSVNLQSSAGGQRVTGGAGVAVDGEGQAVGASTGSGEDARLLVIAIPQVHEGVAVGDELVVTEGAKALQVILVVQSDGEGAAAGCRGGGEAKDGQKRAPCGGMLGNRSHL